MPRRSVSTTNATPIFPADAPLRQLDHVLTDDRNLRVDPKLRARVLDIRSSGARRRRFPALRP
jgi:hypothetical protein